MVAFFVAAFVPVVLLLLLPGSVVVFVAIAVAVVVLQCSCNGSHQLGCFELGELTIVCACEPASQWMCEEEEEDGDGDGASISSQDK